MAQKKYDLIIVGGGVLGAFHAYHALQKGLSVAVMEKDKRPLGATVRNFGQVVPSGMNTRWQQYGRVSLEIYKEIQKRFDITLRQNGSVYLASNAEEVQLIEELSTINKTNCYESWLLTKEECLKRYPGLREEYVKAGLFFPQEVTVEPRVMVNRLLEYMVLEKKLDYHPNTQVLACEATNREVMVVSAAGRQYKASKLIICCGTEFKTLYPKLFEESDLQVTKLQMLQTIPQKKGYTLSGSILTGLSIRRYEAFQECPSYPAIKAKEDMGTFDKKWGIHILFKQAVDGSVIIGDSHEYADAVNSDDLGFDLRTDVDEFMIAEAQKIFDLPSFEIQNRWLGMYSQCKNHDIFECEAGGDIQIITGIGGKGMTGSGGYAAASIQRVFNTN